jgi:hypothetical protein
MMMSSTAINTQAHPLGAEPPVSDDKKALVTTSRVEERLQATVKSLGKPAFSPLQLLASTHVTLQAEQPEVVLASTTNPQGHQAKYQSNHLIEVLQAQVEQVEIGLAQLMQTQQVEADMLALFQSLQQAFQANKTNLSFQRQWKKWLQALALLEQQTTSLYSGQPQPSPAVDSVGRELEPYCLPRWLTEGAPPETLEALTTYGQFWLTQQAETAKRQQCVQHYYHRIQIKVENWLAAQTAPKSN